MMISRAAKYMFPIGATVLCMPHSVFAADKKPSCVYDEPKKESCGCPKPESTCKETDLERLVMKCRQEFAPLKDDMSTYSNVVTAFAKEGYNNVMDNVVYLRCRAPDEVRIGTIFVGGLVGMMLGFRRGLTKKIMYGGLGAVGASYMVYPTETLYYGRNGFSIAQKYLAIAYNFVTGEKTSKYDTPNPSNPCGRATKR